jgi:hypothetical protein
MTVTYDSEWIRRETGADVPLQMNILLKNALKGVSPHQMYLDGKATYEKNGLSESAMVTHFAIDLIREAGYDSYENNVIKNNKVAEPPVVVPIAMTEQQKKIYEATGAEVSVQMSILSENMWKGITPGSMYMKGERVYKGLGLTREEMEVQFTIEMIQSAGCSCKNKSEIKHLSPVIVTPTTTTNVQMTTKKHTSAEIEIYKNLGLSPSGYPEA